MERRPIGDPRDPGLQKAWRVLEKQMGAEVVELDTRRRTPVELLETEIGRIVGRDLEALGYAGAADAEGTVPLRNRLGVGPVRPPKVPGAQGR